MMLIFVLIGLLLFSDRRRVGDRLHNHRDGPGRERTVVSDTGQSALDQLMEGATASELSRLAQLLRTVEAQCSIRWRSAHAEGGLHRARNVLAKVPVEHQGEVKVAFWKIFDDIDAPAGERAIAVARARATEFATTYEKRFPAAVGCLMTNLESLMTYLRFPADVGRSDEWPMADRTPR